MKQILQDLIVGQAVDLINANIDGIAEELGNSPDGKLSVSVSLKLAMSLPKLYSQGGLSYARRFKDEVEGSADVPDPNQPGLPLLGAGDDQADRDLAARIAPVIEAAISKRRSKTAAK